MTNLKDFTPETHTNDLRGDVLTKTKKWRFIAPVATLPVLIIVIGVLIAVMIRYGSYNYQALLNHQVEMVKAENEAFVELAKRKVSE